jgi:hypothetical protein
MVCNYFQISSPTAFNNIGGSYGNFSGVHRKWDGRTIGKTRLQNGRKAIILVLDEPYSEAVEKEMNLKIVRWLRDELKKCEPLPPEFDEILAGRLTFTNEHSI